MARRTSRLRRTGTIAALTVVLLSAASAATAVADPVQDPILIGPDTAFSGLVNGASTDATIKVACLGPIVSGQTGHPLAGQTVQADSGPVPVSTGGYTGSAAHSLVVTVAGSSPSGAVVVIGTLTSFFAPLAIPTSLNLPCGGTTTVRFTPSPTSPTARPATVQVTLVSGP
jgi:hypothetical protein